MKLLFGLFAALLSACSIETSMPSPMAEGIHIRVFQLVSWTKIDEGRIILQLRPDTKKLNRESTYTFKVKPIVNGNKIIIDTVAYTSTGNDSLIDTVVEIGELSMQKYDIFDFTDGRKLGEIDTNQSSGTF